MENSSAPPPKVAPSEKPERHFSGWALALAAAVYLCWHFLYRLASSGEALLPFDGPFNDGPFQLHNPLRRMDLGQTVGTGFSFFHGPAIPALHYPLHWLAGKTIHASELSRHLVSMVGFHVAWVALFWVWFGSFRKALVPWALAVMASDAWDLWQLAECDNSLYGLRGIWPLLAVAGALGPKTVAMRGLLAGFFAGLALLMGTEQGLATVVSATLVLGLGLVVPGWQGAATRGILYGGAGVAVGLCLPLLLLGGLPALRDFFQFNLGIVPADQFWYFGVPPNPFIHTFRDLFTIEYVRTTLVFALTAGVGLVAWLGRTAQPYRPLVLGALLIHGLLCTYALMGVLNPVYIGSLRRDLIVILLAAGGQALQLAVVSEPRHRRIMDFSLAAMLVGGLVFWPTRHRYEGIFQFKKVATGLGQFARAVGQLPGGEFSPRLRKDLDQITQVVEEKLPDPATRQGQYWSTFTGLPDDQLGILNPSTDYIIHALGPRRAAYDATFRETRPALVLIPARSKFPYEQWLRDSHWAFYEFLLLNYSTRLTTSGHVLLERKGEWREPATWEGMAEADPQGRIRLPAAQAGKVLSVELEYTTTSRWGWLPMVGKLPRWLIFRENGDEGIPVSLPPGQGTWAFSCRAKPGVEVILNPVAASPWGGRLTLAKARWRWVDSSNLSD